MATTANSKAKAKPKAKVLQTTELPKTAVGLTKEADRLRQELRETRTAHALQKLDSPVKLRTLRRQLARILTVQAGLKEPKDA